MTMLLVLRPQPGADATVGRAKALGLDVIAAPLVEVTPLRWDAPEAEAHDAVLMTSANAARLGGEALASYRHLPVFAVGGATEAAARDAGFLEVVTGERDGAAILDIAVARGKRRLLHLAGRDHIDLHHPETVIDRRIVYAAEPTEMLSFSAMQAIERGVVVLLHSPRAAALFGKLIDRAALDRGRIAIVAISEAVCAAAGPGWAKALAAPVPTDEALLEIAARLCDQGADQDREDQR